MKITAHSLDIKPTQKLRLPTGARLLTVNVDHRFNKCLLWTYQDDNAAEEELTFTMAKLGDEVRAGEYVGTFKDNSGYSHVFAERPKRPDVVTAAARFEAAHPLPDKPVADGLGGRTQPKAMFAKDQMAKNDALIAVPDGATLTRKDAVALVAAATA